MRANIDLEDDLVEEAFLLTGIHSKNELLNLALRELIASRKRKSILDLNGQIEFSEKYDYKKLRELNTDPN